MARAPKTPATTTALYVVYGNTGGGQENSFEFTTWDVQAFLTKREAQKFARELNGWCQTRHFDPASVQLIWDEELAEPQFQNHPLDPRFLWDPSTGTEYDVGTLVLAVPDTDAAKIALSVLRGAPDYALLDKLMEERTTPPGPKTVWVLQVFDCVVSGTTHLAVHPDRDSALKDLAKWCRGSWADQWDASDPEREELPEDDVGAVERYFGFWDPEITYDLSEEPLGGPP